MNLSYSGTEAIDAGVDEVYAFITDPSRMGQCLPQVQDVVVHDATSFDAVVKVAVGLVRGKFKYKVTLVPDPAAKTVVVKTSGGGMGSAVDMTATANLSGDGAATTLAWSAAAVARGPVAAVGGRVIDAQAHKLIAPTFTNIRDQINAH